MALFENWKNLSEKHADQDAEIKFWEEFLKVEATIYKKVLDSKRETLNGTISELAAEYGTKPEFFLGFLDGINDSIKESLKLEELEADTKVDVVIDWELLYKNMIKVEATWLSSLDGWNSILSESFRKAEQKSHNREKMRKKSEKPGRNDACPCGSGKKYKKCCGKNN